MILSYLYLNCHLPRCHNHPPIDAELARAADEEEFLQSPEVAEDAALGEARAKLEYIASVLGMISSIEAAVPKVGLLCLWCV